MSKNYDKRIYKKVSPNILAHKNINTFIESINFRVLYFLFIECRCYLKGIKKNWKKKKPPLSLSGSGVDLVEVVDALNSCTEEELAKIFKDRKEYYLDGFESLHYGYEGEDVKNSNINEGHAVDKAVESKIDVVNLEIFEQIQPEE